MAAERRGKTRKDAELSPIEIQNGPDQAVGETAVELGHDSSERKSDSGWTSGAEATTDLTEGTDRYRWIRGHPFYLLDPWFLFSIFGSARLVRNNQGDCPQQ